LTEADVWRWVRPSWARLYCVVLAAPAVWAIWWLVLEADHRKVVIAAACGLWLFFILRTWFWYEKPKG
jgi:uncharacterized protein (DUF58 family)